MINFDNSINKNIDLLNNDGLSIFNGHSAQQHHNAFKTFYDFIENIKPSRIIEIGTAMGGFSAFLGICKQDLNQNIDIITYDIVSYPWYDQLINYGVDSKVSNIFNDQYSELADNTVSDFISSEGLTLVLCDGGCKKCEFNILSKYLKTNDIIMTHDYAPNETYFKENMNQKIWNWHEIQDLDIIESIESYNLIEHEWYDKFVDVAWGCFKKQ
jgi:hypothetical protein